MKHIKKSITSSKTYYKNPDFDELFIFLDLEVPTSNKRFHQVDQTLQKQITEKFPEVEDLYFREDKHNAKEFRLNLQNRLLAKKRKRWPYKEKLLLYAGIMGNEKFYSGKDLDNLLKSILDAFEGIVYENDKQVEIIIAGKHALRISQNPEMKGLTIGLSVLNEALLKKYSPNLYSLDYRDYGERFIEKHELESKEEENTFEEY